jgi:transmembrane sensor
MNRTRRSQERELALAEEAAEWLYSLENASTKDSEGFAAWLLESPRHVEAFLRVSLTDASLAGVDPARTMEIVRSAETPHGRNVVPLPGVRLSTEHQDQETSRFRGPGTRRWFTGLAISAAVVGILASGNWAVRAYQAMRWSEYATASGETASYALPDGSTLQLGPASRVDVRYVEGERLVRLEAGEALFSVHHDASRPFRVHSRGVVVEALGTVFTVRQRPDEAIVSVVEGRVRVDKKSSSGVLTFGRAESSQPGPDAPAALLKAGEQARITRRGLLAGRGTADPDSLAVGLDRRLTFHQERLEAVVSEFNRFNPRLQMRVDESDGPIGQRFTGSFEARDAESFLAVLEKNPLLEVERTAEGAVVRPR